MKIEKLLQIFQDNKDLEVFVRSLDGDDLNDIQSIRTEFVDLDGRVHEKVLVIMPEP